MAVSKRLRYEILRRDNHTCRYCGASAPDVKLTVDHVTPVALGGTDGPENLVAACSACNAGKSSSQPDAPLVANVQQDALRWNRAIALAAQIQHSDLAAAYEVAECIRDDWRALFVGTLYTSEEASWYFKSDPERKYFAVVRENDDYSETSLELCDTKAEAEAWLADHIRRNVPPVADDYRETILTWYSHGLRYQDFYRAMDITKGKTHVAFSARWKYFCGVVWNILRDRQQIAQDLLARADADGEDL